VMGTAAARDIVGEAQRLLCATAGGVPPDLVWFDRFAIGEWASRGALTNLTPLIDAQNKRDPYRIDLTQYYRFTIEEASYRRPGFAPNFGNSWLYMFAWQAGGELLDPTRTRVTMDSPPVVRALRFMTDVYDDLGGFQQVDSFKESFQGGGMDPFIRGQVAMKI